MDETMQKYKTEQETFWAGEFGNNYIRFLKEMEDKTGTK